MRPRGWLFAFTLAFFIATTGGYGYFRDELYYLACGRHLDFGYVDHPPLIGLIAAATRGLLGDSRLAIRLPSAVAAALAAWLAGAMAREMGGGLYAQLVAGCATLLAPLYLSLFSILSMNAFDVVFWAVCWWLLARILRTGEPRWWLPLGIAAGVGLENKISLMFLGFGIAVGVVVTRRWDLLRSRWPWIGAAAAVLLFLPHLVWQHVHGWPTLEFMDNARRLKNVPLSPAAFLGEQVLMSGPTALPIMLAGLAFLLIAPAGRRWRVIGWTFLAVLVVMIATRGKAYYFGPAYTVAFAAGGVALEGLPHWRGASALRAGLLALLIAGGILAAPLAKPLLPIETYVRYAAALGLKHSPAERHELGRLPQTYADMHGWPELARTVARVYDALPEQDRARACVFGQNYGQAGAIDFFGPALGLPGAISAHNSYFLWGPGNCSGEVVIVIGDDRERLEEVFERVDLGATHTCKDCMPYENDQPIWVGRGMRLPLDELWPAIKRYI